MRNIFQNFKKYQIFLFFAGIICFIVGLIGLIVSSLNASFSLDSDQLGSAEFVSIDIDGYNSLINQKKSFVLFIDQDGCTTADALEKNLSEYMDEHDFRMYRFMFSEMRQTSLYSSVKYYPSAVIVREGKPIVWLRADSDEDTARYNDLDALKNWFNTYLKW